MEEKEYLQTLGEQILNPHARTHVLEEIQEHIDNGTTTFGSTPEQYRVDWEGIACWPNLGYNLKTMKKYGINCVTNGYVGGQ